MVDKKVQLIIEGLVFVELFVLFGIMGFDVVDVWGFIVMGYFIFDFGFMLIVFCELKIIYIDGDKGVFFYCGYFIE